MSRFEQRMLGRGAPVFEGSQGEILALPFKASRPFEKLVSTFHIHPRIVKTVKNKEACYFSVQHHHHEEDHGYDWEGGHKGEMISE